MHLGHGHYRPEHSARAAARLGPWEVFQLGEPAHVAAHFGLGTAHLLLDSAARRSPSVRWCCRPPPFHARPNLATSNGSVTPERLTTSAGTSSTPRTRYSAGHTPGIRDGVVRRPEPGRPQNTPVTASVAARHGKLSELILRLQEDGTWNSKQDRSPSSPDPRAASGSASPTSSRRGASTSCSPTFGPARSKRPLLPSPRSTGSRPMAFRPT